MPFGHWKDFDSCLADIKRRNPNYSDEVVHKVCGKLKSELEKAEEGIHDKVSQALKEYVNSKPSPTKEDLKEVGPIPIHKAWEFDPTEILSSPRKVKGTFHVPKVDKDNEIITDTAMQKAIPDFIHLPILHDFHRERVLGLITKVYEEAGAYHFEALFKATHDVDDAWAKVQKGEYDHVSIYGSRLNGSPSCGLDPNQRSTPCISHAIRLDSISACDDNARNDATQLVMAKSQFLLSVPEESIIKALNTNSNIQVTLSKAETTSSGLMHGTYDGVKSGVRRKRFMVDKDVEKGTRTQGTSVKEMNSPSGNRKRDAGGSYSNPTTHRFKSEEQKCGCEVKKTRVREVSEDDPVEEEVDKAFAHYGRGASQGSSSAAAIHEGRAQNRKDLKRLTPSRTEAAGEGMRNLHKGDGEEEMEKGSDNYERSADGSWRNAEHNSVPAMQKKFGVADPWNVSEEKRRGSVKKSDEEEVEKGHGMVEERRHPSDKRQSAMAIGQKEPYNHSNVDQIRPHPFKHGIEKSDEEEVEKGDWVHSHGTKEGLQATHHGSGVKPRTKQKPGDTGFEVRQNKSVEKAEDMDDVEKAEVEAEVEEDVKKGKKMGHPEGWFSTPAGGSPQHVEYTRAQAKEAGYKTPKGWDSVEKATSVEGMFKQIISHLKQLVASDKKVHSEIDKAEPTVEESRTMSVHSPKYKEIDHERSKPGPGGTVYKSGEEEEEEESTGEEKKADDKVGLITRTSKEGKTRQAKEDSTKRKVREGTFGKSDDEAEVKAEEEKKAVGSQWGRHESSRPKRFGTASAGRSERAKNYADNKSNYMGKRDVDPHGKPHYARVQKADTMTDEVEEIVKAELTNEMTDEQFVTEIVKANIKTLPNTEEIVKAALEKQSSEIMKALDDKFKVFEERLKKVEENPIQKAAVVISETKPKRRSNMDAIAKIAGDV